MLLYIYQLLSNQLFLLMPFGLRPIGLIRKLLSSLHLKNIQQKLSSSLHLQKHTGLQTSLSWLFIHYLSSKHHHSTFKQFKYISRSGLTSGLTSSTFISCPFLCAVIPAPVTFITIFFLSLCQ